MTDDKTAAPRGLGGWLILLVANIVLLLAAYAYLMSWTIPLIRFEWARAATFSAALWPFLRYSPDAVIGIVLPIVVLALFARRHRAFPAACVAFFALLVALPIFDQALLVAANWDGLAQRGFLLSDWRAALIGFAFDLALLTIWSIYLRGSVRVANTFK